MKIQTMSRKFENKYQKMREFRKSCLQKIKERKLHNICKEYLLYPSADGQYSKRMFLREEMRKVLNIIIL